MVISAVEHTDNDEECFSISLKVAVEEAKADEGDLQAHSQVHVYLVLLKNGTQALSPLDLHWHCRRKLTLLL